MVSHVNNGAGKISLLGLPRAELESTLLDWLRRCGEPQYRLGQISEWVYRRTPGSFGGMTNLPESLRARLESEYVLHPLELVDEQLSSDGTRKYLWRGDHSGTVESVVIPDSQRVTYCVSTQAGCPVKCTFCATGYGGFQGQLTAADMVDQVVEMRRISGAAPTNVVFMGMGEPLLNFEPLTRALDILTHPEQVGVGARRITVSTVGIPEKIVELGRLFPQVKLALSLHAGRDELRDEIIPLNRKYPLAALLDALAWHTKRTGKKVTLEYILLPDVNDTRQDAREVAAIATRIPSHINLIGYNPFPGGPYEKPSVRRLTKFRGWLGERTDVTVTIRRSRGEDIQGACGQLSLRNAPEAPRQEDGASR